MQGKFQKQNHPQEKCGTYWIHSLPLSEAGQRISIKGEQSSRFLTFTTSHWSPDDKGV